MSEFILRSARFLAAECLEKAIRPGDVVVDATMGNGHDTEFIAKLVGETGHVYAFDVQKQAVENTRQRLLDAGLLERATLFLESHARMGELIQTPVRAVVFNLGWLPGGDKSVTTHLDSTMAAVQNALDLLAPLGLLVMCVYPGHEEGTRELKHLQAFFSALPPRQFNCLSQCFINAGEGAPQCFILQKQAI